jgi:hypothetical protein
VIVNQHKSILRTRYQQQEVKCWYRGPIDDTGKCPECERYLTPNQNARLHNPNEYFAFGKILHYGDGYQLFIPKGYV